MLRIQAVPFYARWTRFTLALLFVISIGLLPSVVMASSTVATTPYNEYYDDYDSYGKCTTHYTVHRGDTLSRIAARYGVSVYALARINHIANIHRIYSGQYLCIPGYHKADRHEEYDDDHEKDYGYHKPYGDSDHDRDDEYSHYEDDDEYTYKYRHHDDYANKDDYGHYGQQEQHHDDEPYVYTSGYYESTGGHTGICYYPDPRYDPEDAYYYGDDEAEECYQRYPQRARYP
jgi:LysM repeat protein